jgi:adenylosuccinate lyase
MGFDKLFPVTGQTYSRKVDVQVLNTLCGIGQSAHKWGSDLRLLAHRQEIDEPFEPDQVGSSAMAYKRNPMRAERMCSLARFLMGMPAIAAETAATQWLERTLDDSAVRRLTIPQAFLCADAVLRLGLNLARGLIVNREVIARNVREFLPYMLTENIMMEAVASGADRQDVHERVRQHSHAVTAKVKNGTGSSWELLELLRADPVFQSVEIPTSPDVAQFHGRSPAQVEEFLATEIAPIRCRYAGKIVKTITLAV